MNQELDPDEEAPGPARRPRHRVYLLLGLLSVVLLTIVGAGLYIRGLEKSIDRHVERADLLPSASAPTGGRSTGAAPAEQSSGHPGSVGPMNIVLIGSDSRDPTRAGAGRSDVLMLFHLSGDGRTGFLISFPRDMYVDIPGHGQNKINAAFAFGGAQLAVATIENLVGAHVDHAVVVDFEGFIRLTQQLGGVTVKNRYPSSSGGYVFPVGMVTLTGDSALAYVRERHQLPHGDLDRGERQRVVLRSMMGKILGSAALLNPSTLSEFIASASSQVTVDQGMTTGFMLRTFVSVRTRMDNLRSLQAPLSGFGMTSSGQSIDVVDQNGMRKLRTALQDDQMELYWSQHPHD